MELNQKRNFKQELIVSLAASAFLALTVFIFGPVQVYLPNSVSFPYMFNEVLLKFLPVALVALLLLTAILASIPGKFNLHRKLAALMVGGSVLLWLQGNIILWNYGVLDGSDIKWGELHLRGIIDGLIWLVVLALVFFKWEQVYKYAKKISIFFILIQLLYTVALFFQYPAAGNVKNFTLLDDTNQFGFSSKRNIIVLIVDGFQSDLFQELMDEDPDNKKTLEGFTYYRNALAGFPLTRPSVPFILTGARYDNSIPFDDFVGDAYFSESSLPWMLKENGYRVDILMDCGRCFPKDKRLISNLKEDVVSLTNSQAGYLLDLTLFKYFPHFLKRVIYNDQHWRFMRYLKGEANREIKEMAKKINPVTGKNFSNEALDRLFDVKFAAGMLNEARVDTDKDIFKFYHLKGVHAPFRMNEKLEFEDMKLNRPNWKKLAKGSLKIVDIFLEELKRLNVYDRSMIFIVADHGHSGGYFGLNDLPGVDKDSAVEVPASERIPKRIMESGLPLILVKRFNETGTMKTSDSPVSLSDIPNTVFTELGISGDFAGEAMFRVEPSAIRPRRFTFFKWGQDDSVGDYFPVMKHYTVTGHSWLQGSWRSYKPRKSKVSK